eukprot:240351_1
MTQRWLGYLAVSAAMTLNLTLGVINTFGNLLPYIASYFAFKDNNNKESYNKYLNDCSWIWTCQACGLGLSMAFGGKLESILNVRKTVIIGCFMMTFGVTITYFTIQYSFILTLFSYGIFQGIGVGIAYIPCLMCGLRWYENNK